MDYVHPVETVIPGVQGRILGVLTRTETELTMRTVARLAEVSPNRATTVLHRLVELGLVERRDVGTSALVRLIRDNEASRIVSELAQLPSGVIKRLADAAIRITPPPVSITLFGSFARGQAREDSDIDVLVVRPDSVAADHADWIGTLGHWADLAARVAGNPVNLIVASQGELPLLAKRQRSVWARAARDGVTLLGGALPRSEPVA
ncbi:MAG: nucleotidyltransferase domain-containing protein [Chloroflexota bacterium]